MRPSSKSSRLPVRSHRRPACLPLPAQLCLPCWPRRLHRCQLHPLRPATSPGHRCQATAARIGVPAPPRGIRTSWGRHSHQKSLRTPNLSCLASGLCLRGCQIWRAGIPREHMHLKGLPARQKISGNKTPAAPWSGADLLASHVQLFRSVREEPALPAPPASPLPSHRCQNWRASVPREYMHLKGLLARQKFQGTEPSTANTAQRSSQCPLLSHHPPNV